VARRSRSGRHKRRRILFDPRARPVHEDGAPWPRTCFPPTAVPLRQRSFVVAAVTTILVVSVNAIRFICFYLASAAAPSAQAAAPPIEHRIRSRRVRVSAAAISAAISAATGAAARKGARGTAATRDRGGGAAKKNGGEP
jgi:hypothetical protein